MKQSSLVDYLSEHSDLNKDLLDILKYNLNEHIYYYGEHFKYSKEEKTSYISIDFHNIAKRLYVLFQISKSNINKKDRNKKLVLSNAYFSLQDELIKLDYDVYCPSWSVSKKTKVLGTPEIFRLGETIKTKLKSQDVKNLLTTDFFIDIKHLKNEIKICMERANVKAMFVPNDISFFENLSVQICNELEIPSFIFLHGFPCRYNKIDENRTQYLIVWGEKIKESYVKAGIREDKIFVSGHPYYKYHSAKRLQFSKENILIITKSVNGSQYSDKIRLSDRGNLILYLFSIENVLKRQGITSVRFRPHPSENAIWYLQYLNSDFFKLDNLPLNLSIKQTSLVIGPTSSVLFESLFFGVNYIVYEPNNNNLDLINFDIVPPFDGSDPKIPVAKNEEELEYILRNKILVDPTCFNDYISTPFDLSFVKNLIK